MKTWNAPVVAEMNVEATANGCKDCEFEFCVFTNDSKKEKEEQDS